MHLENGNGRADDPVGQPLLIVAGLGRLESLDGEEGRDGVADETRHGRSERKHVEPDADEETVRCGAETSWIG